MAVIWAAAAIAISAVGTGVSVVTNKRAAEETQKVQAASDFEARQTATRRRVRERRIAEARLRQGAATTGTGGSSGEAGALSSISTQFASAGSASAFAAAQGQRIGEIRSDQASGQALGAGISAAGSLVGATGKVINT